MAITRLGLMGVPMAGLSSSSAAPIMDYWINIGGADGVWTPGNDVSDTWVKEN